MLEIIRNHAALENFVAEECCENSVGITIDAAVAPEDYVIIKVDDYYNSLGMANTPAAVDCLIIRKCLVSGYGLTLVELKNIREQRRFSIDNLKSKFENCLNDFIRQKFREIYNADFKDVKLYFVSNIRNHRRDLGLMRDTFMGISFEFKGRKFIINPVVPQPTIKNCN